jgi:hypothetical protein
VHVTAVGRTTARREAVGSERATLETIAIGPHSPKSATDFFLLNLARARADAIVTTGKILRDEPAVEHRLQGADGEPAALAAWRRERLGKREPPCSVVLTTGREIDLFHPLFRSAPRVIILTGESAAGALRERAASCRGRGRRAACAEPGRRARLSPYRARLRHHLGRGRAVIHRGAVWADSRGRRAHAVDPRGAAARA